MKYNGWTNYATWRINLEIFSCISITDFYDIEDIINEKITISEVANFIREYVENEICINGSVETTAESYALAFIDAVNWQEIAVFMIEDAKSEAS